MWKRAIGFLGASAWLAIGCASQDSVTETTGRTDDALVRGTPVPTSDVPSIGRPYVMLVLFQTNDGYFEFCSGSYFAPRVLLTAAHCVPPTNVFRVLAYWGNDLAADIGQMFSPVPPPGEPSLWAQADSWEVNPGFVVNPFDADLAVIYLDRKPPFDPLPLYRNRLDSSWTNQQVTLVGWGANLALSEDTQQNEGFGIKRTGTARVIGTPTLADYQPSPAEVPLLSATVRGHNIKLNGQAPNVNLCAGDSGGPIIVNRFGQDYIAGVASRTGPWCENLSLFTRIDPYLPFLDTAYRRGGQEQVVPFLDCVDTRPNGKLTAYFGYKNDNGVSVSVPYDNPKNWAPLDTLNERPSLFRPGEHHFQFGVDFNPGQTVSWKLQAPVSPATEVKATAPSPRCADEKGRRCARYCEATVASECIDNFDEDWDSCINACLGGYRQFENQCEDEWADYLACVAATPPDEELWFCEPFFELRPRPPACDPLVGVALDCLYASQ